MRDITHDEDAAQIAASITLAKGVETPEQPEFLKQHGCDKAQDYLFNRPLTEEQATLLINAS